MSNATVHANDTVPRDDDIWDRLATVLPLVEDLAARRGEPVIVSPRSCVAGEFRVDRLGRWEHWDGREWTSSALTEIVSTAGVTALVEELVSILAAP